MRLDLAAYTRALAAARLDLAVGFNPDKHPRDHNGRWAHVNWDPGQHSMADLFDNRPSRPTDTQDLHTFRDPATGNYRYTDDRAAFHRGVIASFLQGKTATGAPSARFSAGGPASGKSSVVQPTSNEVHIDLDQLREQIPEYQRMIQQGERSAPFLSQKEAHDMAALLTAEATDRGLDVVIDGTGRAPDFPDQLLDFVDRGYRVAVSYVDIPTDEAIKREQDRRAKTGRGVNHDFLRDVHGQVARRFKDVLRLAKEGDVDLELWDNTGTKPERIAHVQDGELTVSDLPKMRAFLKKGDSGRGSGNRAAGRPVGQASLPVKPKGLASVSAAKR